MAFGFLKRILGGESDEAKAPSAKARKTTKSLGVDELAKRLGLDRVKLTTLEPRYTPFTVPKRSGGTRMILAPSPELKSLQRRILKRLLGRLRSHPAAKGFERNESIVTNAKPHVGKDLVIRLDIKNFFAATTEDRVKRLFERLGWNADATALLVKLCVFKGGLPPGAPTSPKLANLVNYSLDVRLSALAAARGAIYTRYADDLTFSANAASSKNTERLVPNAFIGAVEVIARDEGYTVHRRKKRHVRRRHQRQLVTGLVVNTRVGLPRETRRRLRAIEHHLKTGKPATLTNAQLDGWNAFRHMIEAAGSIEKTARP